MRAEQRLARVDIPDADDLLGVHDQKLDRDLAPARGAEQVLGVKGIAERLGGEVLQQAMALRIRRSPEQAPEASGVMEAEQEPVVDHEVPVIVSQRGSPHLEHSQAS